MALISRIATRAARPALFAARSPYVLFCTYFLAIHGVLRPSFDGARCGFRRQHPAQLYFHSPLETISRRISANFPISITQILHLNAFLAAQSVLHPPWLLPPQRLVKAPIQTHCITCHEETKSWRILRNCPFGCLSYKWRARSWILVFAALSVTQQPEHWPRHFIGEPSQECNKHMRRALRACIFFFKPHSNELTQTRPHAMLHAATINSIYSLNQGFVSPNTKTIIEPPKTFRFITEY